MRHAYHRLANPPQIELVSCLLYPLALGITLDP